MTTNTQQHGDNVHALPRVERPVTAEGLSALLVRLAEVMAREVDALKERNREEMHALQADKGRLTSALERQLRILRKRPQLKEKFTDAEQETLVQVFRIFSEVLEENRRQLLISKEVNMQIIRAIAEAVGEAKVAVNYGSKGNGEETDETISVTLDERI